LYPFFLSVLDTVDFASVVFGLDFLRMSEFFTNYNCLDVSLSGVYLRVF
jgi:hypothetical protein